MKSNLISARSATWRRWIQRQTWSVLVVLTLVFAPLSVFASDFEHVVQAGETLSGIAVKYGVDLSTLMAVNGITNANSVRSGQSLTIPDGDGSSGSGGGSGDGGGSYVIVRPGDTISQIAQDNGVTTAQLLAANGMSNANWVRVGQTLYLPSGSASAVTESASSSPGTSGGTHVVQAGETLSGIALNYGVSTSALMLANGLSSPNLVRVGAKLTIPSADSNVAEINFAAAPSAGAKLIEVDLTAQTLTAWNGSTIFLHTNISSGTYGFETVTGRFAVYGKTPMQTMYGPGYNVPDVPYVIYFHEQFAFHGAYWHNEFGRPMSHGCIHLVPYEAHMLYQWASYGTAVYVHE